MVLRSVCIFISITGVMASHAHLVAQQVTSAAPLTNAPQMQADTPSAAPSADSSEAQYPDAEPIPPKDEGTPISIYIPPGEGSESHSGSVSILDGHATITYGDRVLQADHIEYNSDTGDVTMTGHVVLTEAENELHMEASHGTLNLNDQTGRFYDVSGSVGLKQKAAVTLVPTFGSTPPTQRYTNGNPFLFNGKMMVRTGPLDFDIYDGNVTSCQLPSPDWLLSAQRFNVAGSTARANNAIFHLMSLPVLWLPFVTHPVNTSDRQTGILIPEIGINSASKGDTIGEQIYWAINRSTDLTVGTIYYSARGWEQTANFRYHGLGEDFVRARYSGLQDRGYYPGGVYVNQSGTDIVFSGRRDLFAEDESTQFAQTRMVADVEYLSSFPYREAFSTNFNQAVSSDVVSTIYGTHEWNGMAASLEGDRYQGEKRVATTVPFQAEEQVHIFHAPSLEFTTTDQRLGWTGIEWDLDSSVTALKRTQPNFETSGMIERLDVHPELAYPLNFGGWYARPSLGGRETFYSRSRLDVPGGTPVESTATLNRADLEVQLDLRPPVVERTFDSGFIRNLLRHDVKHTIEPEFIYRYETGIDNFPETLRFDEVDIASNTNEFEYGDTQRLFLRRPAGTPCRVAGSGADALEILGSAGSDADAVEEPGVASGRDDTAPPVCGNREWISWRVAQKYFFNQNFSGAVTNGPRSILQTTLDFSGISFLTGPRDISPIISRLRVRTSEKTDVEWDMDYDTCSTTTGPVATRTCQSKFTANNIYVDVHQGSLHAGVSYARLNAPARSYVEGALSSVAEFNQMRVLLGFRDPARPGFSAKASAGIDIDLGTVQYGSIQASYNWNCCGLSVEYSKYELGTARNDNGYKFNFSLANIGSAGNIRRADQVF